MTTTLTLNLTQAQLEQLLVATTRLLTYYTSQKHNGNDYAAASIPDLVHINHQVATRLRILKHQAVFHPPQQPFGQDL